ncbi:MAG TPA: TraB/GumN family protein, partial [Bacteroidales bacterium]|nr:TraB/GumN family protein [Bacteroidales bacterium]
MIKLKKFFNGRILVSGLAILLCFNLSYSQSLLWKISGKEAVRASYLYGTIHIADPRVFEWEDSIYKYLDRCEAFAAELDLSMETMITIAGMMMLPEGQTLRDRFTPEEYEMIKNAVKECSTYDISMFDKMKPPALIAICFANKQQDDLEGTVDELLYRHAKSKGLSTFGIETVEEQIALFDKIPDSYVVEYFRNIEEQ